MTQLLTRDCRTRTHISLFVHREAICLTYVDDCLWFGKDCAALDALINQMKGKIDLKVESNDVSDLLGIKFKMCQD